MTRYVALLRAVNVGGAGALPMSELRAMCVDAGFARVETYVASGNVVFESAAEPVAVRRALSDRLRAYAGKPVGVLLRSADEMRAILEANPFPEAEPKFTYGIILDDVPPVDALAQISGQQDEQVGLGAREIYVHYPGGMGRSRLKIPAARTGTARNMNTIARLVEIASKP